MANDASHDKPQEPTPQQVASELLQSLSREALVKELSQALLREYMHRKGYRRTLAKFDEESPRTTTSISSRQVMTLVMALQAIQSRCKKPAKDAKDTKPPTIMEMLCSYRLRKRDLHRHPKESKEAPPSDSSDEEKSMERRQLERQMVIARREVERDERQDFCRLVAGKAKEGQAAAKKAAKKHHSKDEEGKEEDEEGEGEEGRIRRCAPRCR